MTPRQIRLLQRSFALIEPIADNVGLTFYERLFARAPETRSMFKGDIDRQQRKLMNFFGEFVRLHLRSLLTLPVTVAQDPEVSIPGIMALAERHGRYGVVPEHFVAAKEALFWSFNQHLRDDIDHETLFAWGAAFDMIAEAMIRVMAKQAVVPKMPQQQHGDRETDEEVESLADVLFRP